MKIGIAGPITTSSFNEYLFEDYNELPTGLGGTSLNNLILGLLAKGKQISIYTLDPKVSKPIIAKGKNLTIYYGKFRKNNRIKSLDFCYREWKDILSFILSDEPDIVSAHWGYEFAVAAIKSGIPHIITLRDSPLKILKINKNLYRFSRFILNKWVMRRGQNFIAISPYIKDEYRNKYDMEIIPNSTSIPNSTIKRKPNDKVFIVSILSDWSRLKNPKPAVRAFNEYYKHNKNVEYHLYGKGCSINGIGYKWAKKNNLLDGIHFKGYLDYSNLMNVLNNYHLLIHPSLEESFGNTLIEAMARGIPVIAGNKSGAVPWVLNYGENGILIDITSSSEIYMSIKFLFENQKSYELYSEKGIEYCNSFFSLERIADKYLKAFSKII